MITDKKWIAMKSLIVSVAIVFLLAGCSPSAIRVTEEVIEEVASEELKQ